MGCNHARERRRLRHREDDNHEDASLLSEIDARRGQTLWDRSLNDEWYLGDTRPVVKDLRHRRASIWHQGGLPARVLAERLGHSKPSMSLDEYSHTLDPGEVSAEDSSGNESGSREGTHPGVVPVWSGGVRPAPITLQK
jgi:integrase